MDGGQNKTPRGWQADTGQKDRNENTAGPETITNSESNCQGGNEGLANKGDFHMKVSQPIADPNEGPQPLVREIPDGAPYPVASLGPLQGAVEDVQGATLAPYAIAAGSALAVASLAVQGFANVQTLGGGCPSSLYMLTIARSGERKSSCDALLMAALHDHEEEQDKAQRKEKLDWKDDHALWKAERDGINREQKKPNGMSKAEAKAALKALGPAPKAPPAADRTVTEPTFEGLTKLFLDGNPSLGIFSDEGGQFLGGQAMNSENRQKTMAAINALWDGKGIKRTRAGDGHVTLYGRRLAIHLMVQPGVALDFLSDRRAADTGFLARFLTCEPPSTIGTRMQSRQREGRPALGQFSRRLRAILETPLPINSETGGLNPRELRLSADAYAKLAAFSDVIEAEQAPTGDLAHVTGTASKAAEQAARIAAVLTLFRDLNAKEVALGDMNDGIALAQYYLSEASRLANAATKSERVAKAEALRRWLIDRWESDTVTVRDVVRGASGALRESPTAREAIKILEQHGWLERVQTKPKIPGRKPTEAWRVIRAAGNVV